MNIEDYREYCLSLGTEVEEKLPFQKFKSGESVLVLIFPSVVTAAAIGKCRLVRSCGRASPRTSLLRKLMNGVKMPGL